MNLAFACLVWTAAMFNFYLITFYLKYFPGSIFLNSLWFALSDLLSFTVSGAVLKFTGSPNRTLLYSFLLSGCGAVAYLTFYEHTHLVPLFILLSRMGNSMAFNAVYVSNTRFFPTHFLTSTYGIVNFVSHMVSVGAPLVAEVSDPWPFGVYLVNSVIGAVASRFL